MYKIYFGFINNNNTTFFNKNIFSKNIEAEIVEFKE